jgi:hypothetical protein
MPASYPTSAKVFTTKNPGDTILASTDNEQQDEITAIEQDLIAGLPVSRGGTGNTSLTANRIPYGNGTSALQTSASLTFDGTTLTAPATTITQPLTISGAAAGQIVFPASQNASSNANTLDDYEEGTWTPVIGGSGGTSGQAYTTQVGRYVKIGKLVTCWFNVVLSTAGTITDNAQIQGLPFTVENTTSQLASGYISNFANLGTNVLFLSLEAQPNTTAATVKGNAAAAASAGTLLGSSVANTTQLVGCITFTATA